MRVIDLVCGLELTDDKAVWSTTFGDDTFYFCSEDCRDEFEANPAEYLDEEPVLEPAEV